MIGVLRRWVRLWDRREAPLSLAMIRVAVGITFAIDLLVARWLGVVEAIWGPPPIGMGHGLLGKPLAFPLQGFERSVETAWLFWTAALVLALLFAAGFFTRFTGVLWILAMTGLAKISPDADRGIDQLFRIVVFVLVLSNSHAIVSVDAWLKARVLRRRPPSTIFAWPRYVLFLQLVWMYFTAGAAKHDPAWGFAGGFSALSRILTDPHYAAFGPAWIARVSPLTRVATASTLAFEIGAPLFLFASIVAARNTGGWVGRIARSFRIGWLVIGFGFHVGIAITMRLGLFPFGVLAIWPAFFHPRVVKRTLTRVRGLLPGG